MADAVDNTAQIRKQLATPGGRALLVAAVGLVMLVPLLLVQGLVSERMARQNSVTSSTSAIATLRRSVGRSESRCAERTRCSIAGGRVPNRA